jgi:hypothetical protein
MRAADVSIDGGLMPEWHQRASDNIDRIDWQPFEEFGQAREPTPRAALAGTHEKAPTGLVIGEASFCAA